MMLAFTPKFTKSYIYQHDQSVMFFLYFIAFAFKCCFTFNKNQLTHTKSLFNTALSCKPRCQFSYNNKCYSPPYTSDLLDNRNLFVQTG